MANQIYSMSIILIYTFPLLEQQLMNLKLMNKTSSKTYLSPQIIRKLKNIMLPSKS